ncbi:(2Fe-2S) ferredoxin domain-containing protein [Calditrichota bacterium LG25]
MKTTITICLGSSCFTRGNNNVLKIIQEYIKENELEDTVILKGALCEDKCKRGPNIKIGESEYSEVDPGSVIDILNHYFGSKRRC